MNKLSKLIAILMIGVFLASVAPVFAEDNRTTTTGTPKLTDEQKILEAQKKLEERFQEARKKLQERLTKLQQNQVNQTAAINCVGLAVGKREAAISDSFAKYSTTQAAALSTRAAALSQAWSKNVSSTPKTIRVDVDKAWSVYRTAHKTAVQAHNASTTAAWSLFKKESVACKASQSGVSVDARSYGMDSVQ